MSEFHILYGLRIESDFKLPGVPILSTPPLAIDVRVRRADGSLFPAHSPTDSYEPRYVSTVRSEDGQPNLRVTPFRSGTYFDFAYSDGVRFAVEREAREVWAGWPEGYTLEDAATYLVGPVMGFVLRLRGVVPLHASAVAIERSAVVLMGAPGAGKSTTAAAFARHGFAILCDDLAALTECGDDFLIQPGYPRLNLWPDSVRALLGSQSTLPSITPTWGKRYMPLGEGGLRFQKDPLSLSAIYVLSDRNTKIRIPAIEEVNGAESLTTVSANTYVNYLLDRDMRRREFDVLSRLVTKMPVRRVCPPSDPSAVFGLCQAIADDARRLVEPVLTATTSPCKSDV